MSNIKTGIVPGFPGSHAPYLAWTDAGGNRQTLPFDVVVTEEWDGGATVTEHPVEQGANVADHVRVELRTCKLSIFVTNEPIDDNFWLQGQDTPIQLGPQVAMPPALPGTGIVTFQVWDNQIDQRNFAGQLTAYLAGLVPNLPGPVTDALTGYAEGLFPGRTVDVAAQTDAVGLARTSPGPWTPTVRTYPQPIDAVTFTHALLEQLKDSAQLFDVFGSKSFCGNMVIESLSYSRSEDEGTGESVSIDLKEIRIVTTQTTTAPIPRLPAGGGKPTQQKGEQNPQPAQPQVALDVVVKNFISNGFKNFGGTPVPSGSGG